MTVERTRNGKGAKMMAANFNQQKLDAKLSMVIQKAIDAGDIKEVHLSSLSALDGTWDDDDEAGVDALPAPSNNPNSDATSSIE